MEKIVQLNREQQAPPHNLYLNTKATKFNPFINTVIEISTQ